MADDAKNPTADKSVDKKGQAKDETNLPLEATKKVKSKKNKRSTKADAAQATAQPRVAGAEDAENTAEDAEIATEDTETSEKNAETNPAEADATAETTEANAVEADTATKVDATTEANATTEASATINPDFQAEIRDQIENCKFEIVAALQESVHNEMRHVMQNQIRKTERRRVFGVVVRDILILILIVIAGFFAYRLYEYGEFKFLFPACDQDSQSGSCENQAAEPQP